jgi:hypothetical protein
MTSIFIFEIIDECDFNRIGFRFVALGRRYGEDIAMAKCEVLNAENDDRGWSWRMIEAPLELPFG